MLEAGSAGGPPAPVGEGGVWHSRLYLPHYELPGAIQMLTFRLADSLPAAKLEEIVHDAKLTTAAQKRQKLEDLLDMGYGACYLNSPVISNLVEANLLHFDGTRYIVNAWVIMPN